MRRLRVLAGFVVGTAIVVACCAYLLVVLGGVAHTMLIEPTAPTKPWPPLSTIPKATTTSVSPG